MARSEGPRETKKYNVNVSPSEYSFIKEQQSEKPHGTTLTQLLIDAINGRPENDEDSVEKIYESMCGTEARLKEFMKNHKSVYEDAAEFIGIVNECLREYSALMSAAKGKGETHD